MKRNIEPGMLCQVMSTRHLGGAGQESGGTFCSVVEAVEYVGDYKGVFGVTLAAWKTKTASGETLYASSHVLYPIPPDATDESAEDAEPVGREVVA